MKRTHLAGIAVVSAALLLTQVAPASAHTAAPAPIRTSASGASTSSHAVFLRYGTAGTTSASTDVALTTVTPEISDLPGGGVQTVYPMPDGEVMTVNTPPAGFDPLTASDDQLAAYNFPRRPADPAALQDWTEAMAAYKTDQPPGDAPLEVAVDAQSQTGYSTYYTNWSGYSVGNINGQSNTYVAVKADVGVPSTGTCNNTNGVAFWVGLGGTTGGNNLVQEGIECGNSGLGTGSAFRPWTEFANTAAPKNFCGYTSWTFSAGHTAYENMSYEVSNKRANFYIQDLTSGVAHSCSATPPSGWSYDDNVADWVAEAPSGVSVNFGSSAYTAAYAELDSTGAWVTLGSQSKTTWVEGSSSSHYCISPSALGTNTSFTQRWHQSSC